MVNIFSIITSLEPVDTVKNDRVGAKLNWVQNPYIYTRGGVSLWWQIKKIRQSW